MPFWWPFGRKRRKARKAKEAKRAATEPSVISEKEPITPQKAQPESAPETRRTSNHRAETQNSSRTASRTASHQGSKEKIGLSPRQTHYIRTPVHERSAEDITTPPPRKNVENSPHLRPVKELGTSSDPNGSLRVMLICRSQSSITVVDPL